MKLNLTVEGRILASIPLTASAIKDEYYLKAFRRLLTLRHQQKLAQLHKQAAFEVELPDDKKTGMTPMQVR